MNDRKGASMDDTMMPRLPYLTTRAHKAFGAAHRLVDQFGHDGATQVHLAVGVVQQGGVALAALYNLRVPPESLEKDLTAQLPAARVARPTTALEWSDWDQQMIESAREEA